MRLLFSSSFAGMLSFNKAKLNKKLTDCKTVLSKKGFQEYREGNLNEAIALWQGYLAVDPHNADIRKAVNTATLQQKISRKSNSHQLAVIGLSFVLPLFCNTYNRCLKYIIMVISF